MHFGRDWYTYDDWAIWLVFKGICFGFVKTLIAIEPVSNRSASILSQPLEENMNKKVTVLWGALALAGLIAAAAMAYGWLTDRADTPDSLLIADTAMGPEYTESNYDSNLPQDAINATDADDNDTSEDTNYNPYGNQPNQSQEQPDQTETTQEYTDEFVIPQAPDFAMYDMYGNQLLLSDFVGKPIVLNFWATWCPSCVIEMPYFQQLYEEMGSEVHILKINLLDGQRETRERVDQFIEDNGLSFPIFFDSGDGAFEYGVSFIPVTFFIDADGYATATSQGAVDEDILRRGLETAGVLW